MPASRQPLEVTMKRSLLRHVASLLLVLFVSMIVSPTMAYADEEGVAVACGEDQNGQQKCAVLGTIVWGSGGAAAAELTMGEFAAVWYFVIISWAVWEAILTSGNPPPAVCYNCQDGFTGRINATPTP